MAEVSKCERGKEKRMASARGTHVFGFVARLAALTKRECFIFPFYFPWIP